jgi:hypothetical protein
MADRTAVEEAGGKYATALARVRELFGRAQTARAATETFRASYPVASEAPHDELLRVREVVDELALMRQTLLTELGTAHAHFARHQVLVHQAPYDVKAMVPALDAAGEAVSGAHAFYASTGQPTAFMNAILRVHMETGGAPAPAGDGLGEQHDGVCVVCKSEVNDLGISPAPGTTAAVGVTHCTQGASNQCTCFPGRTYRACAGCWSKHVEKELDQNMRHAVSGPSDEGPPPCCVSCIVCKEPTCAFRIRKNAAIVVPVQDPVPPPPQQQQQQQAVASIPPPGATCYAVPPPSVSAAPLPDPVRATETQWLRPQSPFGGVPMHGLDPSGYRSNGDGFMLDSDDLPNLLDGDFDFDNMCMGLGTTTTTAAVPPVQFNEYGPPGSGGPSPDTVIMVPVSVPPATPAELVVQGCARQSKSEFETLHDMLDRLAECLKDVGVRSAASAKTVKDLIDSVRGSPPSSDPLGPTDGGVGKRTTPSSPVKPAPQKRRVTKKKGGDRACTYCSTPGHNIRGCPKRKGEIEIEAQRLIAERDQQQQYETVVLDRGVVV